MPRGFYRKLLPLCSVFLAGGWLLVLGGCGGPHDEQLAALFSAHRTEFEQLRTMLQEDKRLVRVSLKATLPESLKDAGIPPERLAQYRKLIEQLGLQEDIIAYTLDFRPERNVEFVVYRAGPGPSQGVKGLVWSPDTLNTGLYHVVGDIDAAVADMVQTARANGTHIPDAIFQKPIEGNWKIYFSNL